MCISYVSCCCDKELWKNVRERGSVSSHSSRGQSAVVGRSWWQEFEAAGHTVSTVRKQRGLSFVPSFFFPQGMVPATVGRPCFLSLIKIILHMGPLPGSSQISPCWQLRFSMTVFNSIFSCSIKVCRQTCIYFLVSFLLFSTGQQSKCWVRGRYWVGLELCWTRDYNAVFVNPVVNYFNNIDECSWKSMEKNDWN